MPRTAVPPMAAVCALATFGSFAWCWHCSVRKQVNWKSPSKELGGISVEGDSANLGGSAQKSSYQLCWKCLHLLAWTGSGLCSLHLVLHFLRHQYNKGKWEQLGSPFSLRSDSSPWYCLLQALCSKDVCWEVVEIQKTCSLSASYSSLQQLGWAAGRLCALGCGWEAPARVAGLCMGNSVAATGVDLWDTLGTPGFNSFSMLRDFPCS